MIPPRWAWVTGIVLLIGATVELLTLGWIWLTAALIVLGLALVWLAELAWRELPARKDGDGA